MRSIPVLPALLAATLSLPALAANGEREALGTPAPSRPGQSAEGRPMQDPSAQGQEMQRQGMQEQDKAAGQYAPDNTGRNRQHDTRLEADDQSSDPADVKVVSAIRRALTDDSTLSLQGHNVKIIVQGGRVTLRGPVAGEAEKRKVEAIARKAAGGRQVVNELEATGS